MVRSSHKIKILFGVATILAAPAVVLSSAHATNPEDLDLQVNIAEALTVTVTNPETWAHGGLTNVAGDKMESNFLRNKVSVSAITNNPTGLRVSMYTKGDTDLRNTTNYSASDTTTFIPTLNSTSGTNIQPGSGGANFPVNYWGYSVDDAATLNPNSHYQPLSTSAIQLFDATYNPAGGTPYTALTGSQDVYFGAKANNDKQSGTYARTVYFAAVTGTINTDPTDPEYNPPIPSNPSTPDPVNNYAHYTSSTGRTTYTQRTTSGTGDDSVTGTMNNTQTDVTAGDVTTTYAQAYGVTSESNIGPALAAAFAVAAGVSAASGFAFFIVAKRKKDDDDEEGKVK